MCISATVLAMASTAVSTLGAVQQANAQKAQAEYNAAVAKNNAAIAAQNEADIIQRGEVAREMQLTKVEQTMGAARAAIGGSGIALETGGETTTGKLLGDLRAAGQFDIMTLKNNIDREARRARIEGTQFEAQAGLLDLQARSINPLLAGAVAGLSGARSIYDALPPSGPVFGGPSYIRPRARPADLFD